MTDLDKAFPNYIEQKKTTKYVDLNNKEVTSFKCDVCGPGAPIASTNDGNQTISCGQCWKVIAKKVKIE